MTIHTMPRLPSGEWKCGCGEVRPENQAYCNGCNCGPQAKSIPEGLKNNARTRQMESHGVDRAKHPFASFCFGYGWQGHRTLAAARRAVKRKVNFNLRHYGGGEPQNMVCETREGKAI